MPTIKEQPVNNRSKNPLGNMGWYLTFALIPFDQTYPGLLFLLISKVVSIFNKTNKLKLFPSESRLVSRTNRLFIYLLISLFISGIFSPEPLIALSLAFAFSLLFYIFTFGAQHLAFSDPNLLEKSTLLLCIGGSAASIIALIRYYALDLSRAGIFSGPNTFGTVIIMYSGIIIGFLFQKEKPYRYLTFPFLFVSTGAMLATKSRGAWLGFIGMLISFMVFNKKLTAIFLIILLLTGVFIFTNPTLNERFLSIFSLEDRSNLARIHIWEATLEMIKDNPVFGVGAGVYPLVYSKYVPPHSIKTQTCFSHNLFLQVAAEFGIVGFVIFMLALCHVLYMAYSLAKTGNTFYQGLFAMLIGVLIHQQFDIAIWKMNVGAAFWLFIGIIIGLYRREFQQTEKQNLQAPIS